MVQVGVVTVRMNYERLDEEHMAALALRLFTAAEDVVLTRLRHLEPRVEVELEEGSLKVRTRILATAGLVGTFLSNYGSIRQGAESLASDVMSVSSAVVHKVTELAGVSPKDVLRSVRSATLTRRIRYVVDQVDNGKLSADSGAKRIIELLDPDKQGALSPELLTSIKAEIDTAHAQVLPQFPHDPTPVPSAVIEEYTPIAVASSHHTHPAETPEKPRRLRVFRDQGGRGRVRVVEE
jgi:hypothetical protein